MGNIIENTVALAPGTSESEGERAQKKHSMTSYKMLVVGYTTVQYIAR